MLLKSYQTEIFNSKCMPGAMGVHCHAILDQDVSGVLPYLNAELGGTAYCQDPPSVTFQVHGKLITVHARKIAINALKDAAEAEKILAWLQSEINAVWARRHEIQPRFEGLKKPVLLEILKLLPRTNCRECGEPTCMVFAARAVEGVKDAQNCPGLTPENKEKLAAYLAKFDWN